MKNKDDGEDKGIIPPTGNGRDYDRDRDRDRDRDYDRDRDRRDRDPKDRDRDRRESGELILHSSICMRNEDNSNKQVVLDRGLVITGSPKDVEVMYGPYFVFQDTNLMHSIRF